MSKPPIRVGILGLGFMGRTHLAAYRAAHAAGFANSVVAVCDPDPEACKQPRGNLKGPEGPAPELSGVKRLSRAEELLDDASIDHVSICTPTDTHVDLALAALERGKHVLVEKPIALEVASARRLADAARKSKGLCMPAMCIRFWPGWDWLRERIATGTFGAVRSAVFRRLGARPAWGKGFYEDTARSGGALFDLHVHDADFVRFCFGDPARVTAVGSLDHLTCGYHFEKGPPHVVAEGGWDHAGGFPFRMAYTVAFEQATADFDSTRAQPLLLAVRGRVEPVELEPITGWDGEVRHILAAISSGSRELRVSADDALAVTRLLNSEAQDIRSRMTRPV